MLRQRVASGGLGRAAHPLDGGLELLVGLAGLADVLAVLAELLGEALQLRLQRLLGAGERLGLGARLVQRGAHLVQLVLGLLALLLAHLERLLVVHLLELQGLDIALQLSARRPGSSARVCAG